MGGSAFTDGLSVVDVTEIETLDATALHKRDFVEDQSANRGPLAVLMRSGDIASRANECTDTTEWAKVVCENMPNRAYFWGAGGILTFYYAPTYFTNWVNVSSFLSFCFTILTIYNRLWGPQSKPVRICKCSGRVLTVIYPLEE
jgi:hypothetical protein